MTLYELNNDQKQELRQMALTMEYGCQNESPSWFDLANAERLVPDSTLELLFGTTIFTEDDFLCSKEAAI